MLFFRIFLSLACIFIFTGCSDSFTASPSLEGEPKVIPFALGQIDVSSNRNLKSGMKNPFGVATAGSKLFVSDSQNNRILGWNSLPVSNDQPPDFVLGQPDFTSGQPNFGGVSASSLNTPLGIFSDGARLFVVDNGNSRVLIWNSIPFTNGAAADVVIGQQDMVSFAANNGATVGNPTSSNLKYPSSVTSDGTHMVIADTGNNRVLIWNSIPTGNGVAANVVLGQPDFVSASVNNDPALGAGTVSSQTLSSPQGVAVASAHLFVADTQNHRALIFNTIPTVSQSAADVVIGQIDMGHQTANSDGSGAPSFPSAANLNGPYQITSDGSRVLIADTLNNRILIYSSIPASNATAASVVIGQSTFSTDNSPSASGQDATAASLEYPMGVFANAGAVWIADYASHRILKLNTVPVTSGASADLVLGQTSATTSISNNGSVSESTLNSPQDVFAFGSRLFVADSGHNRVLIWNSAPLVSNAPASVVVGQASPTTATVYDGGLVTARSLASPTSVATDGVRMAVVDFNNNRVLIWNAIPTSHYQNASVVLGQTNMNSNSANQSGSPSPSTLQYPYAVRFCQGKLVISDSGNNRVLIWNTIPNSNNAAADIVLGQADGISNGINRGLGTASSSTLNNPSGIACPGSKLIVSDTQNHRVLIWNSFPSSTGAAADLVMGQATMTDSLAGTSSTTLNQPTGLFSDGTKLWIADSGNNRVLVFQAIPTNHGAAADQVFGQLDFITNPAEKTLGASSLNNPVAICKIGDAHYISDNMNSRVIGVPSSSFH